jgi:hypothetical protein
MTISDRQGIPREISSSFKTVSLIGYPILNLDHIWSIVTNSCQINITFAA